MRKKFTMLLAALFLVMGTAWALPTEGQLYRIKSVFTENYLDITSTQTHGIKSCSLDALDVNQCFYFIPKEGSVYYIKSANNQYVAIVHGAGWDMCATNAVPADNNSAEITLVSVTDVENQYYLQTNNTASWGHCIATQDGNKADGAEVFSDKAQDDKSKWEIVAVTEAELTALITAAKGELASVITEAEGVAANAFLSASDAAEKTALSTAITTAEGLSADAKIEDITAAKAALQTAVAAAQQYIQLNDFTYVTALGAENSNHPLTVSTVRSNWAVDNNATSMSTISKLGLVASAIDAKQQFAIITPDEGENHYIYSVNAKRFLKKDNTFGAQGDAIQLNDASEEGANRVQFQFKGTSKYINVDNSNPRRLLIDGWDDIDEGNACLVASYNQLTFDLTEALDIFNNGAVITLTYKVGDKTTSSTTYKTQGETYTISNPYQFTTIASCTKNGEALTANEGVYSFEIDGDATIVVELQENLPFEKTTVTDGAFAADTKWYLLRQSNVNNYWEHDDADKVVKVKNSGYSIYEAKQLWCFTGNVIDGFKVYNKAAGATYSLNNESPAKLVQNNAAVWEVHTSTQAFTANDARFGLKRPNGQYANLQSNSLKGWSLDAGSTTNAINVSAQYAEIAANWEKMIMAGAVGSIIGGKAEQMRTLIDAYVAAPSQANEDAVNNFIADSEFTDADRLQLKQDAYYMIVSADGRFFANQGVEKALYSDGTNLMWGTRNDLDRAYFWKLEKISDKWHLKNFKDSKNMAIAKDAENVGMMRGDEVNSETHEHNLTFTNIANTYTQWNIYFEHNTESAIHAYGHTSGDGVSSTVCIWGGGEASDPSAWRLIEVTEAELVAAAKAELNGIMTTLKNGYYDEWAGTVYKWRDQPGVNNYTLDAFYSSAGNLEAYYNAAKAVYDSEESTVNDVETQISLLSAVLSEGLTINLPEAGKFYRLRCVDGKNYLQSTIQTEGSHKDRLTLSGNQGAEAIFLYDGNGLLSYAAGLYMDHRVFNTVGTSSAVIFSEAVNGNKGQYNILVGPNYIYGAGTTLDSGNGTPDKRDGYNWWLEEVTTLPVAVSAIGYATLYAPVALTIPSDVEVYTATINENGTTLDLTQVTGTIPANTGVLLKAVENTYNFNITADVEAIANNAFTGSCAKSLVKTDVKVYTLQNKSNGVGFYKYSTTSTKPINQFRAWIEVAEGASAPAMFSLDRGEGTTGIESVEAGEELVIFDLAGRRVEKMEKGIYIVNGRKVVVK